MRLFYFSVFVKVCFITLHVVHFKEASIDGLLSRLCILWSSGRHIFMFIWSKMLFNSEVSLFYFISFYFFFFFFWGTVSSKLKPGLHCFGRPRWTCWFPFPHSFLPVSTVLWAVTSSSSKSWPFSSLFPSRVAVTAWNFPTHLMSQMPHVSRFSGRIQRHSLEGNHLLFCIIRWMGPIKHLEVPGQPGHVTFCGTCCALHTHKNSA